MDKYLKDIDEYCDRRYDWEKQREQIQSNYVNIFKTCNFEKEFHREG